MQKITPFLWFNDNAEEAVQFYLSVFRNAKVGTVYRNPENGPGKPSSVLTMTFELEGTQFIALNGGPHHAFTPAVSFVVNCESQAEIDEIWSKLSAGGKEVQCGWVTDKFGLSWQVVPVNITELLRGKDAEGGQRAFQAMLQMVKLDIDTLRRAGGLA